jgi:hypothetical protein
VNHRRQVIAKRMICPSKHADPKAGQADLAQLIAALLLAMRTAVKFRHRPRLRAIEIDDACWKGRLSPEMAAEAIALHLLPRNALFGRQAPPQLRVGSLRQD